MSPVSSLARMRASWSWDSNLEDYTVSLGPKTDCYQPALKLGNGNLSQLDIPCHSVHSTLDALLNLGERNGHLLGTALESSDRSKVSTILANESAHTLSNGAVDERRLECTVAHHLHTRAQATHQCEDVGYKDTQAQGSHQTEEHRHSRRKVRDG